MFHVTRESREAVSFTIIVHTPHLDYKYLSTYNQIQQQENQGKLRTFKKFKTNLNFQEYLNDISNIKHRQAVTKLRISSHRLPVESGRYNNNPFDKRTCKLCNLNEVGNEQHYLMQCSDTTDLNYWIKLLSCIIEANGGHIGLSHINVHWYY